MKFHLYSDAVLAVDLPERGLRRGDVVRPVDCHEAPDGTVGYSIEVMSAMGETLAVAVVPENALSHPQHDSVLCVREL